MEEVLAPGVKLFAHTLEVVVLGIKLRSVHATPVDIGDPQFNVYELAETPTSCIERSVS